MIEEVLKSECCLINHYGWHSLFYVDWFNNEEWHDSPEAYKVHFSRYVQKVEEYSVQNVIHDLRHTLFTIDPDLQQWTNEVAFQRLARAGLKNVAFITDVSPDPVPAMSVEQTMSEQKNNADLFLTRYFSEVDDAINWIASLK